MDIFGASVSNKKIPGKLHSVSGSLALGLVLFLFTYNYCKYFFNFFLQKTKFEKIKNKKQEKLLFIYYYDYSKPFKSSDPCLMLLRCKNDKIEERGLGFTCKVFDLLSNKLLNAAWFCFGFVDAINLLVSLSTFFSNENSIFGKFFEVILEFMKVFLSSFFEIVNSSLAMFK